MLDAPMCNKHNHQIDLHFVSYVDLRKGDIVGEKFSEPLSASLLSVQDAYEAEEQLPSASTQQPARGVFQVPHPAVRKAFCGQTHLLNSGSFLFRRSSSRRSLLSVPLRRPREEATTAYDSLPSVPAMPSPSSSPRHLPTMPTSGIPRPSSQSTTIWSTMCYTRMAPANQASSGNVCEHRLLVPLLHHQNPQAPPPVRQQWCSGKTSSSG